MAVLGQSGTQNIRRWMQNIKKISPWIIYAFVIIALVGFLDASYLTVQHFRQASVGCAVFHGCDIVTTSAYSMIGPVPLAVLGMAYYFFMLAGTLMSFFLQRQRFFVLTTRFTLFGFLASVYFVYLQVFVIKALCLWCMLSALSSTFLFILGVIICITQRKTREKDCLMFS